MFHKAMADYLESLKIKVNKKVEFGRVWIFFYMLVLLPCMMAGNEKGIALASYYIMVIPMIFGIYSTSAAPIQLPKQMYICPMEQSERHRYVTIMYWIRLLTPLFVGVVFHVAGAWSGITSWTEAMLQMYALVTILFCISVMTFPSVQIDDEQKDRYHYHTKKLRRLQTVSIGGMLVALFYKVVLVYNVKWQWEEVPLFQIYSLVSLIAMFIFFVLSLTYLKPMLMQLTTYDKSYSVFLMMQKNKEKEELC